ncbi:MAG: hypothetical protein U9N83_14715 [Thermodesulfobacteriota bacterium]|nr:hypothetical protein [Thermodesulfobacteriota bacterium]
MDNPKDERLFQELAIYGKRLADLHLMQSSELCRSRVALHANRFKHFELYHPSCGLRAIQRDGANRTNRCGFS